MGVLGKFLISAVVGGLGVAFSGASDEASAKTEPTAQQLETPSTNNLGRDAVMAAIKAKALTPPKP